MSAAGSGSAKKSPGLPDESGVRWSPGLDDGWEVEQHASCPVRRVEDGAQQVASATADVHDPPGCGEVVCGQDGRGVPRRSGGHGPREDGTLVGRARQVTPQALRIAQFDRWAAGPN